MSLVSDSARKQSNAEEYLDDEDSDWGGRRCCSTVEGLPLAGFTEIDTDFKWIYSSVPSCNSIFSSTSTFPNTSVLGPLQHVCVNYKALREHILTERAKFISAHQLHSLWGGEESWCLIVSRIKWTKTGRMAFQTYRLCPTHWRCAKVARQMNRLIYWPGLWAQRQPSQHLVLSWLRRS